jgi:hypothetical protein
MAFSRASTAWFRRPKKARGYRSARNLKAMIYLIAGRLELALPT